MREIKFRVWDVQRKVLANVTSIMWLSEDEIEIDHDKNGLREPFQVYGYTAILERFTGLHDKNGAEIYEGDIVKHNNTPYVIQWNKGTTGFICVDKQNKTHSGKANWRTGQWLDNVSKYLEIIGNIHEGETTCTSATVE